MYLQGEQTHLHPLSVHLQYHPPINNALGGGESPIAVVHFRCVMHGSYFVLCVDFCRSSRWMFVCLVVGILSV